MAAAVCADRILHRLVFPDRAFCELQPQGKYLCEVFPCGMDHISDLFLSKAVDFHSLFCKIVLHLYDRAWIFQSGLFFHSDDQPGFGELVDPQSLLYHFPVDHDAPVIDLLVEMILVPYKVRDRVVLQALLYLQFYLHVPLIIFLKQRPFFRRMFGKVPGSAAVALGRSAGAAEVSDQVLPFFEFLLVEAEDGADLLKPQRQTVIGSPHQGASP